MRNTIFLLIAICSVFCLKTEAQQGSQAKKDKITALKTDKNRQFKQCDFPFQNSSLQRPDVSELVPSAPFLSV